MKLLLAALIQVCIAAPILKHRAEYSEGVVPLTVTNLLTWANGTQIDIILHTGNYNPSEWTTGPDTFEGYKLAYGATAIFNLEPANVYGTKLFDFLAGIDDGENHGLVRFQLKKAAFIQDVFVADTAHYELQVDEWCDPNIPWSDNHYTFPGIGTINFKMTCYTSQITLTKAPSWTNKFPLEIVQDLLNVCKSKLGTSD
jgi:hypothetical protein